MQLQIYKFLSPEERQMNEIRQLKRMMVNTFLCIGCR